MRNLGRDVENIAHRHRMPHPAINRCPANLPRGRSLAPNHRSPQQQRALARDHRDDVHLRLVSLHRPIAFTAHNQQPMITPVPGAIEPGFVFVEFRGLGASLNVSGFGAALIGSLIYSVLQLAIEFVLERLFFNK